MALTDNKIKSLKGGIKPDGAVTDKPYRMADANGLYLEVHPNSKKYWRYKYRFDGREKRLAIGVYPVVSLAEARSAHMEARQLLAKGVDPSANKQKTSSAAKEEEASKFGRVARAWWEASREKWKPDHGDKVWRRLEVHALPLLADRPAAEIKPKDIIAVTRSIEAHGALDVSHRVLQDIQRIFVYATVLEIVDANPAVNLTGQLKKRKSKYRESLNRTELPLFLKELSSYPENGRLLTKYAMQLLILTFVRQGELRGARWQEFDFDKKVWRIPAERMKMGIEHVVPLSLQSIELLKQIKAIGSGTELLFPSALDGNKPMSENTLGKALNRMGYDGNTPGKSKAVPHGFRATASSILNEQQFHADAIERQLAHIERNAVRGAYTHHASYLDERQRMMQWWADYLDELLQTA